MSGSVSVVMPVRNEIAFIDQSIESILGQTHADFELVIGDDGSTDGTFDRLQEWARRDRRIRVVGPSSGLGPSGSSNWVVGFARHPIVARMDGDDVSHPERLAAQLRALQDRPDAVLVGSLFDRIDSCDRLLAGARRSHLVDLKAPHAPFAHGSIMFRRDAFHEAGGYRMDCRYWEDVEFYWRMASRGRLLVLPRALFSYRHSLGSARVDHSWHEVTKAMQLYFRCDAARREGRDYRKLLDAPLDDNDDSFALEAFVVVGALRIWAGSRPRVLGSILRRGRLGWDRRTIETLVWAAAGEASPRLLRRALRLRAFFRERGTKEKYPEHEVLEWRPQPAPVLAYEVEPSRTLTA